MFKVHYKDGDKEDYYLDELLLILVPEDVAKNFSKHKKIYNTTSDAFTNGTANPSNLPFIAEVFSFKKVSTMSASSLKSKHKKLDIQTHPDNIGGLSPKAQFISKRLNSALRFYFEHYNNDRNCTDILRDPPTAADFPRYGSPEFITQSGMPTEEFKPPSQTSLDLTATHGDSGDSQDEMHEEGIVRLEARDGLEAPA